MVEMASDLGAKSPLPAQTRQNAPVLWLRLLIAVAIALTLALWGHVLWSGHRHAVAHYQAVTHEGAHLLAERVERTVLATDAILGRVRYRILQDGPDAFREASGALLLRQFAEGLPSAGSLWLLDERGDLIATSMTHPAPRVNFSDREYWEPHRQGEDFRIGPVIKGRIIKGYAFTLSRSLRRPDDSFSGVVLVAIHADTFLDLVATFQLPEGATVAIYRQDGALVFRQPMRDDYLGLRLPNTGLLREAAVTPAGYLRGPSPVDGRDNLVAFRVAGKQPLVAAVAAPMAAVSGLW